VEGAAQSILKAAASQMHLSARAYHRILKVARTIADLDGSASIAPAHVAEAVQYRPKQVASDDLLFRHPRESGGPRGSVDARLRGGDGQM
jgi:hypothetical protein